MSEKKIYKALGRNIFVKEITPESQINGWIMPDSLDNDFTFGEVVSASDGYFDHGVFVPTNLYPGDKVTFAKVSGTKVVFNGEKLIRVFVDDIVAKEVIDKILPKEMK